MGRAGEGVGVPDPESRNSATLREWFEFEVTSMVLDFDLGEPRGYYE